jgi:anti-sigma B factor antagonist
MTARRRTVEDFAVIEQQLDPRTWRVSVTGEMDIFTAPAVKKRLMHAVDAGATNLVVDLSGVAFIDSTAVAMLVGVKRSLPEGGRLVAVCTHPYVLLIFEVAGLEHTIEIFGTVRDAERHVQEARMATS